MNNALATVGMVCLLFALGSCAKRRTAETPDNPKFDEKYFTGSLDEARTVVLGSIDSISTNALSPKYAQPLMLDYARLFVIEMKRGDTNAAYLSYEKSKFWGIVRLESTGMAGGEIARTMRAYTPESCQEMIMRFDAGVHTNAPPVFLRQR